MRDDGTRRHVLVIEDDQGNVDLFRDVLEEEQYRVSVTASPDLEISDVLALAPDLLLLDLRFQDGMAGIALLQRLKADSRSRSIPVLVCSADHRQLNDLRDQLVAWDCGILAKPFDLADLLAMVQACLAPEVLGVAKRATRHDEARV
jgi:CheY-like chemotaxis protein